jgi:hypothetical protein
LKNILKLKLEFNFKIKMSIICSICSISIDDTKDTSWYCKDCGSNLCNHCYLVTGFGASFILGESDEDRVEKYQEILDENEELFEGNKPRLHELELKGCIIHRPADSKYFRKNTPDSNSRPKPERNLPAIEISENDEELGKIQKQIVKNFESDLEKAQQDYQEKLASKKVVQPKKVVKTRTLIQPKSKVESETVESKISSPQSKISSPQSKISSPQSKTKIFSSPKNIEMYKPGEKIKGSELPDRSRIPDGYVAYRYFDTFPTEQQQYYNHVTRVIEKLKDIEYKPGEIYEHKPIDERLIPEGYKLISEYFSTGQFGSEEEKKFYIIKKSMKNPDKQNMEVFEKVDFDENVLPY